MKGKTLKTKTMNQNQSNSESVNLSKQITEVEIYTYELQTVKVKDKTYSGYVIHEYSFNQGPETVTHRLFSSKGYFLYSVYTNKSLGKEWTSMLPVFDWEYDNLYEAKVEDLEMLEKGIHTNHYSDCFEMIQYNHWGRFHNWKKPKNYDKYYWD